MAILGFDARQKLAELIEQIKTQTGGFGPPSEGYGDPNWTMEKAGQHSNLMDSPVGKGAKVLAKGVGNWNQDLESTLAPVNKLAQGARDALYKPGEKYREVVNDKLGGAKIDLPGTDINLEPSFLIGLLANPQMEGAALADDARIKSPGTTIPNSSSYEEFLAQYSDQPQKNLATPTGKQEFQDFGAEMKRLKAALNGGSLTYAQYNELAEKAYQKYRK